MPRRCRGLIVQASTRRRAVILPYLRRGPSWTCGRGPFPTSCHRRFEKVVDSHAVSLSQAVTRRHQSVLFKRMLFVLPLFPPVHDPGESSHTSMESEVASSNHVAEAAHALDRTTRRASVALKGAGSTASARADLMRCTWRAVRVLADSRHSTNGWRSGQRVSRWRRRWTCWSEVSTGVPVGRESKLLGQKANPSSAQKWFIAKASSTLRLLTGCDSVELAGGPRPISAFESPIESPDS